MEEIEKQTLIRQFVAITQSEINCKYNEEVSALVEYLICICSEFGFEETPGPDYCWKRVVFVIENMDQQPEIVEGLARMTEYVYELAFDGGRIKHGIAETDQEQFVELLDKPEMFWEGLSQNN
jgi:hypothetical protein